jgi:hypothetical protein
VQVGHGVIVGVGVQVWAEQNTALRISANDKTHALNRCVCVVDVVRREGDFIRAFIMRENLDLCK